MVLEILTWSPNLRLYIFSGIFNITATGAFSKQPSYLMCMLSPQNNAVLPAKYFQGFIENRIMAMQLYQSRNIDLCVNNCHHLFSRKTRGKAGRGRNRHQKLHKENSVSMSVLQEASEPSGTFRQLPEECLSELLRAQKFPTPYSPTPYLSSLSLFRESNWTVAGSERESMLQMK